MHCMHTNYKCIDLCYMFCCCLASLCLVRRRKLLCSCGNCAHGLAASAVAVQAHTRVAVFAALLALEGSICGCLVRSTFSFNAIFLRGLLQVSFSRFQPGSQRLSPAGPVFGEFLPAIYVDVESFEVSLADIFVTEVRPACSPLTFG